MSVVFATLRVAANTFRHTGNSNEGRKCEWRGKHAQPMTSSPFHNAKVTIGPESFTLPPSHLLAQLACKSSTNISVERVLAVSSSPQISTSLRTVLFPPSVLQDPFFSLQRVATSTRCSISSMRSVSTRVFCMSSSHSALNTRHRQRQAIMPTCCALPAQSGR